MSFALIARNGGTLDFVSEDIPFFLFGMAMMFKL
jgi:hypothetical protein